MSIYRAGWGSRTILVQEKDIAPSEVDGVGSAQPRYCLRMRQSQALGGATVLCMLTATANDNYSWCHGLLFVLLCVSTIL